MSGNSKEDVERTTITLTPEVKRKLESEASRTFGKRKGYLSMYVEMTFRNHFGMDQPQVNEP